MTPPRKPRAPPPQVVAGVGRAGFDDAQVHVGDLWADELDHARDMKHRAWAMQAEADAMDARATSLDAAELNVLRASQAQLRQQALEAIMTADAIRARLVANMKHALDYAERDARGVHARKIARARASVVTRADFARAMKITLAKGQKLTASHVRANWPKGSTCPSERHLANMIRDHAPEQFK